MAKYLHLFNLGLIITENCNLRCQHCMRGCYDNHSMSDEVINATLNQISSVGMLSICGGEPLLALDTIDKIFKKIVANKIIVDGINITTNGTIYSDRFISILNYMDEYLHLINHSQDNLIYVRVSNDKYHEQELERLNLQKTYLENIKKYMQCKYFDGLQLLTMQPFREGNATSISDSLTVPLRPMETFITYTNDGCTFNKDGICNIGSLVTVNVNGTITECDSSVENQETKYNYGNVLEDRIEDVFLNRATLVLKPKKFQKLVEKERKKFLTYDK